MRAEWVDFKAIKAAVSLKMVLDHYGVSGLKQTEDDLRGPCPIHKGAPSSKDLSVNLTKNAFKCFSGNCRAAGNVLDFVAAKERCSVRDAALKLQEWFKVGDSEKDSGKDLFITPSAIESLNELVAELEVHNSEIANHSSLIEMKTNAIKKLVASLEKGD